MIRLLKKIKAIPGAISMTEAYAIYDVITTVLTSRTPESHVLDLGSNHGKSSCVIAAALSFLGRAELLHMVDPVYDLNNEKAWKQTAQGTSDNLPWGYCNDPKFNLNVRELVCSLSGYVPMLHGVSSVDFLNRYTDYRYSCIFIDSDDHQVELVSSEVRLLEDRILPGGLLFFHDFKNQYVGPVIVYERTLAEGKFEPVDINWPMIIGFVNEHRLEENNNSWHMPGIANPIFLGALRRKL